MNPLNEVLKNCSRFGNACQKRLTNLTNVIGGLSTAFLSNVKVSEVQHRISRSLNLTWTDFTKQHYDNSKQS